MRGIYNATMGMLNSMAKLNTITNNLANSNTTGFKKDGNSFKAILEKEYYSLSPNDSKGKYIGKSETAVVLDKVYADMKQGSITQTNAAYDFAIEGDGFFKIQQGDQIFYSRNGEFKRSVDGYLVNNSGDFVLNTENEKIRIDNDLKVDESGNIVDSNNTINIVQLENPVKYGQNYFTGDETNPLQSKVKQGYIETSNVNTLNEMVNMIKANREFELLQKAVISIDALNAKAIETTRS